MPSDDSIDPGPIARLQQRCDEAMQLALEDPHQAAGVLASIAFENLAMAGNLSQAVRETLAASADKLAEVEHLASTIDRSSRLTRQAMQLLKLREHLPPLT